MSVFDNTAKAGDGLNTVRIDIYYASLGMLGFVLLLTSINLLCCVGLFSFVVSGEHCLDISCYEWT